MGLKERKGCVADFDQILEIVGTNGRYQKMVTVVTAMAFIPNAMAAIAAVFEAASPSFLCTESGMVDHATRYNQEWQKAKQTGFDICLRYDVINNSLLLNDTDGGFITSRDSDGQCTNFLYDTSEYTSTIVTKWDLVCARMWLKSLSTSMFMLGQLFGVVVFGHLADIIGRKPAWLISVLVTVISGSAAAFVPYYWLYTLLRMLSGVSSLGGCVCTFTLGMEVVGIRERRAAYILPHAGYSIGILILAFLGYFIKDYSWLQLTVSLAALPMVATHWVLGESPKWLLKTGRYEQAEKEIQRMARWNNKTIPANFLDTQENTLLESEPDEQRKHNILDLLRTPNMRLKTLVTWFTWFVTSMIYFGLSLGTGDLAGNSYINLCIAGMVDLAASAIVYLSMERIGRPAFISSCLITGGVFCALMLSVPADMQWLNISFSMVGRLGVSGSFRLIYTHATEFYPTVVRGIGLGAGSMSARVGSLLAPFIADMGSLVWPPLPQVVFASFSILAGCLCLWLPETRNRKLPETLEDGDKFARNSIGCRLCHGSQADDSWNVENTVTNGTAGHNNNFEFSSKPRHFQKTSVDATCL